MNNWMSWRNFFLLSTVFAIVGLPFGRVAFAADVAGTLPKVRFGRTGLDGSWRAAPIIVTGSVTDLHLLTVQRRLRLPPPASPKVQTIYWCTGTLRARIVLKGYMPQPGKPFLWATATPGCKLSGLESTPQPRTSLWLLREEGEWIRPVFDAYGIYWTWLPFEESALEVPNPERRFAELLLTPDTNSSSIRSFVSTFQQSAMLACDLLGEEECMTKIKQLADTANPAVRDAACKYLDLSFQERCH
jgi:hypothetical protein